MMRYIKMFLTHVQTPLHCCNCQKSPISMFFWWFSERDEKQLRCLFQPQMLHSDAQCFFQPLKRKSPPPLRRQNKAPFDSCMVCSQRAFFSSGIHVIGSKMAEGPAIFFSFEIQFEVVVKYAVSWYRCMGIFPTGQLPIGHTCHRIKNGGGPRNISNPESGNSILLGTGAHTCRIFLWRREPTFSQATSNDQHTPKFHQKHHF